MPTPLTPEAISSLWSPVDPRLSPDGRRVVWTAAPFGQEGEHRESSLWVAEVDGDAPGRRWTRGSDDSSPRWSPDGRHLAFLSDRAERGTIGLRLIDVAGGESWPLVERKSSIDAFAWAPDGRSIAFLAADEPTDDDERREKERDDADVWGERWRLARLWTVDVAPDGEPGEPRRLWAPDVHLTALAFSPDGTRLALVAAPGPLAEHWWQRQLWVYTFGAGDGVRLCDAPAAGSLAWTTSGEIAFDGSHDPQPQAGATVWAVSPDGGEPRVVGTGRDESRCTIDLVDAAGADPLLVVADGLDTRLETLDRTTLVGLAGDLDAASVVETADGPVVAVVVEDSHLVARVLVGPPGPADGLRCVSTHHRVDDVQVADPEPLVCEAPDGTRLDAVVLRPAGATDPGPWPTAVIVHGGPYGRTGLTSNTHPLRWSQLLAQHGYAVVMPNYRGGLGRGHDFATAARGTMGTVEWDDVMATVDAAVAAGIADPDRLGIGGWSQGGFLTAWAVTATDRFKVGVMGAGVSDWSMMSATSDLEVFESALGGSRPWDGPGPHHAATGSPISYAVRRTTPLLMLHGADDARVPHSQAEAFRRALAGQDAPVELVTYPREPHGVRERAHQVDLQRRVLTWFDRHVR